MSIPSGKCFCGQVGFYYAAKQHFCSEHRTEAFEAAKRKPSPVVPPTDEEARNYRIVSYAAANVTPFSADRTFRRHIDRPHYNL